MSSHEAETVLRVSNVTKDFYLPHQSSNSLKESMTQVFRSKAKGGRTYHALKGVSFEVKKGDFFGVVGRNGAGKSTLLKIMAEIYRPTTGKVSVKGKLVPFIELGVGFNNNLTGRQNVYLNGALLGFSKKEVDNMYDEIVKFAELEPFMDQKLKNYSSGMRVRLAFSVAIRADADILLLDEVLAVGDADFKKKCYKYFDTLKKKKKTIIFVSHGMGAVREYCNKAILIEDGKIAHAGTADEVADEYTRLFNKPSESEAHREGSPQSEKRWGTREAFIDSFKLSVDEKKLKIVATLKSKDEPVDEVKFGFAIHDAKGRMIAGANNMNAENGQDINFAANEEKVLEFTIPNIFGNQSYIVDATLTALSGGTIYDKWKNVAEFSNVKEQAFYPVVCPAKLTVK